MASASALEAKATLLCAVITPGSFDAATGLIGDTMVAASEYARETGSEEAPQPDEGEGGMPE